MNVWWSKIENGIKDSFGPGQACDKLGENINL